MEKCYSSVEPILELRIVPFTVNILELYCRVEIPVCLKEPTQILITNIKPSRKSSSAGCVIDRDPQSKYSKIQNVA